VNGEQNQVSPAELGIDLAGLATVVEPEQKSGCNADFLAEKSVKAFQQPVVVE